eukprot:2416068-Amphidinium_carterae.1
MKGACKHMPKGWNKCGSNDSTTVHASRSPDCRQTAERGRMEAMVCASAPNKPAIPASRCTSM